MKRLSSLLKRRRRPHVRPKLASVYGPQALEDRSLMALVADGVEFLVNTSVPGDQTTSDSAPAVHTGPNGDFMVVYTGEGSGGSYSTDVFAARYNADGSVASLPQVVNGTTSGDQGSASVAVGNGRAVVVWSGRGTGDSSGIFATILNGASVGSEIAVNVHTAGQQDKPAVAMAANGSFVVAWSGPGTGDRHGIFIRQFAANGTPLTGEIRVNNSTDLLQRDPAIAMNDNGQFVVTWSSLGQDGDGWGVYSRRFNATAAVQGGEVQVNTTSALSQSDARASMADDGSYVVAWVSQVSTAQWSVFARRFAANGTGLGNQVQVNTAPLKGKPEVDIASTPDGRYVITWASGERNGNGPGVFGQAFLADGTPDGGEFRVSSTRNGLQVSPSVSLDRLGNGVFAWSGRGVGDPSGVFAVQLESDRDRTPPVVTAALTSTVANDGTVEQVTLGGTLDDEVNAVTQVQVSLDNGTFVDALSGADLRGNYTLSSAQLADALGTLPTGQHTIRVRAEDEDGNFSQIVSVPFLLDGAPVVVAALAEDNGLSPTDTITTLPTISGTVSDVGQVTKLRVGIGDGQLQDINTSTTDHRGGFTIPQATLEAVLGNELADGQHTVRVQAVDAKNKESNVATVTFVLDRAAPTQVTPLADVTYFEDNQDTFLDMDGLFGGTQLVYSVTQPSGANVVRATMDGTKVNLEFFDHRHGQSQVTVRATRPNGKFVEDTFFVTVIAQNDTPTVVNQLGNVTLSANAANRTYNLGGYFADADELGTLLRFDLTDGQSFGLELFNSATPQTVQNFLNYVTNGRYEDSVLHRLVQGFILQGGGYTFEGTNTFAEVDRQSPVANEPGISNTRGTIAMAKMANQASSATSEFFFNLVNNNDLANPNSLDIQNSGFTAFGRVLGNGMSVLDAINGLTPRDLRQRADIQGTREVPAGADPNIRTVLGEIPLRNFTNGAPVTANNIVGFENIVIDPTQSGGKGGDSGLTITATSSNNAIAEVTVNNKRLTIDPKAKGTVTITVRATDNTSPTALFIEQTFTVTVFDPTEGMTDTLPNVNAPEWQTQSNGLKIWDVLPGTGETAVVNDRVSVHYTGWLINGTQFETSRAGSPATFNLTQVIQGWQQGIPGMKEGGIRRLYIPAALAYGSTGSGSIPPNSDLVFEIKLQALPSALMLAGGAETAIPTVEEIASYNPRPLSAEMQNLVRAAVDRFAGVGLSSDLLARLNSAHVQMADLPGSILGLTYSDQIWLDSDGGGQGWFFDDSPADDLEFVTEIAGLVATQGRVDLLSVAAHEMGHLLGLHDLDAGHGLMSDTLGPGLRRVPHAQLVDSLMSQ